MATDFANYSYHGHEEDNERRNNLLSKYCCYSRYWQLDPIIAKEGVEANETTHIIPVNR